MNIEQIKAQIAEWERLDKERTQGEWFITPHGVRTNLYVGDPLLATIVFADDGEFIAQAPAMFQAVKQLMAENERLNTRVAELKAENKKYL